MHTIFWQLNYSFTNVITGLTFLNSITKVPSSNPNRDVCILNTFPGLIICDSMSVRPNLFCSVDAKLLFPVTSPQTASKTKVAYSSMGKGKGKGKAIPLQAWTGPEGSRRLRLPDFKTIGT
jgi:hypothetical protein